MKVKGCLDCPFRVDKYDDWAVGYDTVSYCNLALKGGKQEHIIAAYDDDFDDDTPPKEIIVTPSWCPLKHEKVEVELV